MKKLTVDQIRRWSDELARDPASPAFFPLADTYRTHGREEAALKLCLRGLERHPHHVDAHVLLGELYRDLGEELKAHDEWDIALSLDPAHLQARRNLGLLLAARGEEASARRHLQAVLRDRPDDEDVRAALGAIGNGAVNASSPQAPSPPEAGDAHAADRPKPPAARRPTADDHIIGAVLLDEAGLLIHGRMEVDGENRGEEVAAALRGASGEAARAVEHLGLGKLVGVLVETEHSLVRMEPVADALLAVAASKGVPLGWLLRRTRRLRDEAASALEEGS